MMQPVYIQVSAYHVTGARFVLEPTGKRIELTREWDDTGLRVDGHRTGAVLKTPDGRYLISWMDGSGHELARIHHHWRT